MKIIVAILFFMIHIAVCSTSNLQHFADDPSERIGREVPKTISVEVAPSINQKPPTIQETVGRHMKLARVFNALYLQMQLADDQIDEFDVIASIWNLKDKTSVEELFRLQVHEIVDLLKPLDTAIKEGVSDAYAKIDGYVTEEDRMNLMNARGDDVIPPFFSRFLFLDQVKNFTINMADVAVKKIDAIEKIAKNKTGDQHVTSQDEEELGNLIDSCRDLVKWFPKKMVYAMRDVDKDLDVLLNGLRSSLKIKTKSADFKPLLDYFSILESNIQKLSSISNYGGIDETKQQLYLVQKILESNPQSSNNLPIGSAFSGSLNISTIFEDIRELWLKSVLNRKADFSQFDNLLQEPNKLATKFLNARKVSLSVFDSKHLGTPDLALDTISVIKNLRALLKTVNTTQLKTCLSYPADSFTVTIEEVAQISNDWNSFISKVPELHEKLKPISEPLVNQEICRQLDDEYKKFKNMGIYIWAVNGTTETKSLFQRLSSTFESFKMDNEFVMAAGRLENAESKLKAVHHFIKSFEAGEKECDALFKNFDLKVWENLNRLLARFQRLRAKSPMEKLAPLLDSLWDTIIELRNVAAPNSPHSSRPKRSTKLDRSEFRAKNPQNLLEFAFSARSLEVMEEVHRHDKAIETIIESGDVIRQRIQSIDDPVLKANLTKVWEGFDATKASLEAIQSDIEQVFARIGATIEESTLKEVGSTYEELGAISSVKYEKIELSGYRQSLVDISFFPVDRNFDDLEKAFRELERPMSMDFEMSFAHFRKVPGVLAELQEDFDNFFADEPSQEEEGSFGYGWIILLLSVGVSLLSAIISRVIYYKKYIQDPEMKQQCPIQKNFSPTVESINKNYTYMQFQDDRFPINQRDSNGNTKMFNALLKGAGSEMAQLILSGAILNATCNGYKHRTALFELLLVRERIWCESLTNTKECPKCLTLIEKMGGCSHMKCTNRKCLHDFCWLCLEPTTIYGKHYSFCDSSKVAALETRSINRINLFHTSYRFLVYMDRFDEQKNIMESEQNEQNEMKFLHIKSDQKDGCLQNATNLLFNCRQTLVHSFICGFYMKRGEYLRTLEKHQTDLKLGADKLAIAAKNYRRNSNALKSLQKAVSNCKGIQKNLLDFCKLGEAHEDLDGTSHSETLLSNKKNIWIIFFLILVFVVFAFMFCFS